MKRKAKSIIIGGALVLAAFIFFVVASSEGDGIINKLKNLRAQLLNNAVAVHFLHSYHSLRKLPDIFFAPYLIADSKLSEYNLYFTPENEALLNSTLPEDPIHGILNNQDRVWVKAAFVSGDYSSEVEIRYRGLSAYHWNSLQKSYKVSFPSDNLFQGIKSMNLIIPYDRQYFIEPLNFYRAKKLGITTQDLYFSRVKINGEDAGVYLTSEHWTDEWTEKRNISDETAVYGGDDAGSIDNPELANSPLYFQTKNGRAYWRSYTEAVHDDSFETLANIIIHADDETFRRVIGNILDMDKFYAWNVMNILAGSDHFSYLGNTFLIFNPVTGRFEFSPWDVDIMDIRNSPDGQYDDRSFSLTQRIFSIPEFRAERNSLLSSYINDDDQLADDLAFYDNLLAQTKTDFYQDHTKLYNNFRWRQQVAESRDLIIVNHELAAAVLDYDNAYYSVAGESAIAPQDFDLAELYKDFLQTGFTRDEFIANNPQFIRQGDTDVVLGPGTYVFRQDVIVPSGVNLVISPGATILLAEDASMIVYGSITAQGTVNRPIRFQPMAGAETWGVFAVVNADQPSQIEYVEFSGGSGDTVNGITFTGMAAWHNSDVDISNSIFSAAGDDDALNVKLGTVHLQSSSFENNFSDGVDLDFVTSDSTIFDNSFVDNGYGGGGDAIDLSWSDVTIERNDINGCTDKGISVGESSKPTITDNVIQNCDIGIAVKDLSEAIIDNNTIKNSRVGISVYQKKDVFGGGTAYVNDNIIEGAEIEHEIDDVSSIITIE